MGQSEGKPRKDETFMDKLQRLKDRGKEWTLTVQNMRDRKNLNDYDVTYLLQVFKYLAQKVSEEYEFLVDAKRPSSKPPASNNTSPICIYDLLAMLADDCTVFSKTIQELINRESKHTDRKSKLVLLMDELHKKLEIYPKRYIILKTNEQPAQPMPTEKASHASSEKQISEGNGKPAEKDMLRKTNDALRKEVEDLKRKVETGDNDRLILIKKLERLEGQNTQQGSTINTLKKKNQQLLEQIGKLKNTLTREQDQVRHQKKENAELLTRLSKIAGDKLRKDNPNIADLSDPNRPTKLAEKYSELYDNEWTDAYEALTKAGHDKEDAIYSLYRTLQDTYNFCAKQSEKLIKTIHDCCNFLIDEQKEVSVSMDTRLKDVRLQATMMAPRRVQKTPEQVVAKLPFLNIEDRDMQLGWKPKGKDQKQPSEQEKTSTMCKPLDVYQKVKNLKKEVAVAMVPLVQKAYLQKLWDGRCLPEIKPFIKQCLYVCWMMVVQEPPMCFHFGLKCGDAFDKSNYKEYTVMGGTVDYVVWPALQLHDNGPLVAKGVAEAIKSTASKS